MNNIEDEIFGTEEEFERRLNEFKDRCARRCCDFISKILKRKFAIIVLVLSIVVLCIGVKVCNLAPISGARIVIYSLTSVIGCFVSMFIQKGNDAYAGKNPEKKALLSPSSKKKRPSQISLEHVMEPRQGSGIFEARSPYQVAYEVHRSDIYEPLNHDDSSASSSHAKPFPKLIYGENSVGTSSTPDPFPSLNSDDTSAGPSRTAAKESGTSASADTTSRRSFEQTTYSFAPTQSTESSDLEEPTQRISKARLSAHVIRILGAPAHVYGADNYTVFQSSDEHTFGSSTSSGPFDVQKVRTFQVTAEVHSDARGRISSSNDSSSSGEPASMASDETALTAVSDHGDSSRQISSCSSGEPASMASDETAMTAVSDHGDSRRQISSSSSGEPASMASDETGLMPVSDLPRKITGSLDLHKANTFKVSAEVHADSSRPISSTNDGSSSSGEPASMASDETALTPVSDSHDIPYIDYDESSESTCTTPLDEESSKTQDKC